MEDRLFAIKSSIISQKTISNLKKKATEIVYSKKNNYNKMIRLSIALYKDTINDLLKAQKQNYVGFVGVDVPNIKLIGIVSKNIKHASFYIKKAFRNLFKKDEDNQDRLLNRLRLVFHMSIYSLINGVIHAMNKLSEIDDEIVIFPFKGNSSHWLSNELNGLKKKTKDSFVIKSKKDSSVIWKYDNGYYQGDNVPAHFWCKLIISPCF